MKKLKKYLKYYYLETDFLKKAYKNFQKRGHLTPEEFFAIVIWKSPRAKTKIRNGLLEKRKSIFKITSDIFRAKKREDKLKVLTKTPGIGIPIASAILTICYPNCFTIVDYRARASLKEFGEEIKGDPTTKTYPYKPYFDYLKKCKVLSQKYKISLRNFDRILWAKNFYEGVNGLKRLVKGLR